MITEREIQIARRLSTRYTGTSAFGREDAYQACIEGYLAAGSPKDEGLAVHVMRIEMHRQSVEASYLMRVPWSSWKKLDETPTRVKYTGLSSETLTETEHEVLATDDLSFEDVEDNDVFCWVLSQLTDKELFRLNRWISGYKLQGRQFREIKDILAKVRELMEGDLHEPAQT